jgi:hypothetical protein
LALPGPARIDCTGPDWLELAASTDAEMGADLMASEETQRLSRRALLAAGAAGVAAAAAQAVTPSAGRAADAPVLLGVENNATSPTSIRNPNGDAVVGGTDSTHAGVYGFTTNGGGWGVFGSNHNSNCWGGIGTGNQGVFGHGGDNHDGVWGRTNGSGKSGVYGLSDNQSGCGVLGRNRPADTQGRLGDSDYGVFGWAPNQRTALGVSGKASFSRSGVLTIPKNAQYAKVADVALTSASFVIATLNQYRSGVWIAAAVPNVAADSITIYLNKKATAATRVAWLVLEKFAER